MITIICGEPGRGKTALMTYFAVQKMVDEGFTLWWQSCREIDTLKKGGFSALASLPQRHTVYADYLIKNKYMQYQSYYTSGFNIALPNPFFQTTFFAPFSQIFLDEAQKYYDSRMSRYLRECVYRFYQLHRPPHNYSLPQDKIPPASCCSHNFSGSPPSQFVIVNKLLAETYSLSPCIDDLLQKSFEKV